MSHTDELAAVQPSRPVVLEARRKGRRPRYHAGTITEGGRLDNPQCNLDDVGGEVRRLDELPEGLPRPWAQLCRRCYRGTDVLAAADELELVTRDARMARRAARKAYREERRNRG